MVTIRKPYAVLKSLVIACAEHNSVTAAAMNFGISKIDGLSMEFHAVCTSTIISES
jgi:hypothetical protein